MKKYVHRYLWKAQIRNYSSQDLWVLETDTKINGYDAVAHILKPGMKTPKSIDIDGFKRVDGRVIEGHKEWWKILDGFQVYIYDKSRVVKALAIPYKKKVGTNEFGNKIWFDKSLWGEKISNVINVERNQKGHITHYYIEGFGKVTKRKAIKMAKNGEVDNVVIVENNNGTYLRSRPDGNKSNNFAKMG